MENIEYNVADYLLKHGEELKKEICEYLVRPEDTGFLRKASLFLFRDEIIEEFLEELRSEIAEALGLTYPEINCIVDRQFVTKLMGERYLEFD